MGKIEDMRRLREQQFAEASDAKRAVPKSVSTTTTATEKAASASAKPAKTAPADDEGKCSVCGKVKPLTNGLVANHQKGFGKACAGSRKEPA